MGGRAVLARSFARIAEANLKKQGVLPLTFADPADYDKIRADDVVDIIGLADARARAAACTVVLHHADGTTDEFAANHTMSDEHIEWFRAGSRAQPARAQAMNRFVDDGARARHRTRDSRLPGRNAHRGRRGRRDRLRCRRDREVAGVRRRGRRAGARVDVGREPRRYRPARRALRRQDRRQANADEARDRDRLRDRRHPAVRPPRTGADGVRPRARWSSRRSGPRPEPPTPCSRSHPDRLLELSAAAVVDVTDQPA